MSDLLDSSTTRVVVYAIAALLAVWWGIREQRALSRRQVDWWPRYWFISALLLAVLAVARASALGDVLGDLGRDQARSSGWYDARRTVQAVAVVSVAAVWAVGVFAAILRVPPRRRRYLPHVVALSAIIAFAAVRLVSLHHVDALLYRRDIASVRVVAILELALVGGSVALMAATARITRTRSPAVTSRQASVTGSTPPNEHR